MSNCLPYGQSVQLKARPRGQTPPPSSVRYFNYKDSNCHCYYLREREETISCAIVQFDPHIRANLGYNLKNTRNGKSISQIPKWPSLKSKFIQQFEFSENLEDIYGKYCRRARSCSPTTVSMQIFIILKIQIVLNCHL